MDIEGASTEIDRFRDGSLRTTLAGLERATAGASSASLTLPGSATAETLAAALLVKLASRQIDEIVHALSILLTLPRILQTDELVEYVSLGAGNTGRRFDLETNFRVAEFKAIDWKGGPESIRQNGFFKDFQNLVEYQTAKRKQLFVLQPTIPLKFMRSGRSLTSVLGKDVSRWASFTALHGDKYTVVGDYFADFEHVVEVVDLGALLSMP